MVFYTNGDEQKHLTDYKIYDPLLIQRDIKQVVNMKAEVKAVIKLEDGKHTGIIQKTENRTEPYNYFDVVIKEDVTGLDIKVGYPFNISELSALGSVLKKFGAKLEVGKNIETDDFINAGLKVNFLIMNKEKDGRTYPRIIPQSLELQEKI